MAETLALDPARHGDEAPLDAAAILSRLEQLSMSLRGGKGEEEDEEEEGDPAAAADALLRLRSEHEVTLRSVDAWDASAAQLGSEALDAYMEWLRKEVSLAEEENQKLSAEIGVIGEKASIDTIQLDADIKALESSLKKIDSEGLKQLEVGLSVSTDSCRNETNVDKDKIYEVMGLDHQIRKSEMDLKLLENQISSMQRTETIWQLESMLSEAKVLDFKGSCLRVLLEGSILTSECVVYGQKLDFPVDSFVSDHELLVEIDETSMELKKVQIFPDDVCVDTLIENLKSSREAISSRSLGWIIRQCQHRIIINMLRRSLVNDANNSRHSFEYIHKDETVLAHLVGGIDAFIKISRDWPLSSYGLKLISIRDSGTQQTNITLNLLCKAKELANRLEVETRRYLVRFVDCVEEILVREMQSGLHSS